MPSSPPPPGRQTRVPPWIGPVVLGVLGALVPLLVWWLVQPVDIGGSDPGMWEAAVVAREHGQPVLVAPFFPTLIFALHGLGASYDRAGWWITVLATIGLGPVTWWLARLLGASPGLAALVAVCALAEPWLATSSYQCQPDLLTAVFFAISVALAMRWWRRPAWSRLLPLLLVIGLLPQVREHAALVAVGLLVVLAAGPGPWHQRLLRVGLGLLAIGLVPALLGEGVGLPWQQEWVRARWGEVIDHFFEQVVPGHLQGTPPDYQQAFGAAYERRDRLGISLLHAGLSFHTGRSPWLWMGLGVAGLALLRRGRLVVAAGLLPAIAVLGGAQQPRHLAVLVPIAAACWAAALMRFGRWERLVLAGVTLVIVGLGTWDMEPAAHHLRSSAEQRASLRSISEQICTALPPEALYIGDHPRTLIYCYREISSEEKALKADIAAYWVGSRMQRPPSAPEKMASDGWVDLPIRSDEWRVLVRWPPTPHPRAEREPAVR